MDAEPYFTADGDVYAPAPHARSWWTDTMLHGRLVGGLLAHAIENDTANDTANGTDPGSGAELHVARLTVDLFRNAPLEPVRTQLLRIRDGRRIRVVEVTAFVGDGPIARATAVLLRQSEQPEGQVPVTPAWDAPAPEFLPAARSRYPPKAWRFDETNTPARHWSGEGRRRVWMQETCLLLADQPLTPLVRAALAADSASPLAHASDTGLHYINADYTLYLSRLPVGDTIGLESGGHTSDHGVAVGHCTMHDRTGPIGFCMTAAVANPGVREPRRDNHTRENHAGT